MAVCALATAAGSSPHTRGTPVWYHTVNRKDRDHPRIRGEHARLKAGLGSGDGIIPAYAGNTCWDIALLSEAKGSSPHTRGTRRGDRQGVFEGWDHPRIRGEHGAKRLRIVEALGIIPAYAGNTARLPNMTQSSQGSSPHTRGTRNRHVRGPSFSRDHPRIRGEHFK